MAILFSNYGFEFIGQNRYFGISVVFNFQAHHFRMSTLIRCSLFVVRCFQMKFSSSLSYEFSLKT